MKMLAAARATRLRAFWLPVGMLLFGLALTGWVARALWINDTADWDSRAKAEAERMTRILGEWIEGSYVSLASLASLFELSGTLDDAAFRRALPDIQTRSASQFLLESGVMEWHDGSWSPKLVSDQDAAARLRQTNAAITRTRFVRALDTARANSNQWVMSEPVNLRNGTRGVYFCLALPSISSSRICAATPDGLMVPTLGQYITNDWLAPLDPLYENGDVFDPKWFSQADMFPAALAIPAWTDRHQYSQSITIESTTLFMNKTMLASAGLSAPQNFDELYRAAVRLKTPERAGISLRCRPEGYTMWVLAGFIFSNGGAIMENDACVFDSTPRPRPSSTTCESCAMAARPRSITTGTKCCATSAMGLRPWRWTPAAARWN